MLRLGHPFQKARASVNGMASNSRDSSFRGLLRLSEPIGPGGIVLPIGAHGRISDDSGTNYYRIRHLPTGHATRDTELVKDGRDAVGMSIGIAKRKPVWPCATTRG